MIEHNNPEININDLMKRVQEEALKRKNIKNILTRNTPPLNLDSFISSGNNTKIKFLIQDIELNSRPLVNFPAKLSKLLPRPFQVILLKLYNFIFKKQRVINSNIIQISQEFLKLIDEQNRKLEQLENKFIGLSKIEHYNFTEAEKRLLDSFYIAFINKFPDSNKIIDQRREIYLPYILQIETRQRAGTVIDVGCGRGEWLKLLKENGFNAIGIDLNQFMIEECELQGLDVKLSDALDYVQSLPDQSVLAITGFHLIEHLPFPILINFLQESYRVLQSQGVVIFETLNPQNISAASHNFYIDPTRRNPLPSLLSQFLLEYVGFTSIEIRNLNPGDQSYKIDETSVAEKFNEYFYNPQDYAVIGYKQ